MGRPGSRNLVEHVNIVHFLNFFQKLYIYVKNKIKEMESFDFLYQVPKRHKCIYGISLF